jgi:hypothetical protein
MMELGGTTMAPELLEGTWEEITQNDASLRGKRVRVTILPDTEPATQEKEPYEEWNRQFQAWLDSFPKDRPALPDEAMSREAIYEGRGL